MRVGNYGGKVEGGEGMLESVQSSRLLTIAQYHAADARVDERKEIQIPGKGHCLPQVAAHRPEITPWD